MDAALLELHKREVARAKAHEYYMKNKERYQQRQQQRYADPELRERERYYKAMYFQEVTKKKRQGYEATTPVRQNPSTRIPDKVTKNCRIDTPWRPSAVVFKEPVVMTFD